MFVLTLKLPSLFIILSLLAVNFSFQNTHLVLELVDYFFSARSVADLELQLFVLLLEFIEEGQIFLDRRSQVVQISLQLKDLALGLANLVPEGLVFEVELGDHPFFDLAIE